MVGTDSRALDQRPDARGVADPVLQHSDPGRGIAQPGQPGSGRRRLVPLGAQQNPVDARRVRRIAEGAQRNLDGPFGSLDNEVLDRMSHAGDDVVAVGITQTAGHDATDAAETDNGDGRALGWDEG